LSTTGAVVAGCAETCCATSVELGHKYNMASRRVSLENCMELL